MTSCLGIADLVITTGGLGPTADDRTKEALGQFFRSKLIWHDETWTRVEKMLKRFQKEPSAFHRQQCMMPDNALIINNDQGSAPGMVFQQEDKLLIAVPGVPHEMKHLLDEKLPKHFIEGNPVQHRFIRTAGEGETVIAEMISDIEQSLPADVRLAYLPSFSQVTLRLSAYGNQHAALLDELQEKIVSRLQSLVYGTGDTTLSKAVGEILRSRGETIGAAESCTGGFFSHLLTTIPGSSDYYIGSVIPYAYRMKTSELNIPEETLVKYGAVSEEVVSAMAQNLREKLNVTWAVATSGIAGPGGSTPEKPVGTIWIACSGPAGTRAQLLRLSKDRKSNIEHTAIAALVLLRKCILNIS